MGCEMSLQSDAVHLYVLKVLGRVPENDQISVLIAASKAISKIDFVSLRIIVMFTFYVDISVLLKCLKTVVHMVQNTVH